MKIFTLQDLIGYFIFYQKKISNVIFECHQLSKIKENFVKSQ